MAAFGTQALQRLPLYLRVLREWAREGNAYASGAALAAALGIESVVVRKDLARTGVRGTPRVGFPIAQLIAVLERLTGADAEMTAVLAGGMGICGLMRRVLPSSRPLGYTLWYEISTMRSCTISVPVVSKSKKTMGFLRFSFICE